MTLRRLPLPDPGTPDLRSPGRFLLWLARMQWRIQTLGVLYGVAWMSAQAAVPAVLGAAVQAAVRNDQRRVGWCVLAVVVLGVVQALAGVMRHRIAVETWITAASRTQQLVARQASDLGADLSRQVATGEVVAVTASDVERIGGAFDVLSRFAGAVVAFIGIAVLLLATSPLLGAVVLGGVPLFALAVGPLLKPLERRESAQRVTLGRATELASDTIAGLRVLRGIGGEELFLDRFRAASQDVRVAAFATARVRSLLDSLQVALPGAFVVTVTWLGARLALDGSITVGQLIAFYGWTAFLVVPLRTITEAAHKWTRARVAAARIIRVLSLRRAVSPDAARPEPAGVGTPVLHDPLTGLDVARGRLTAVVCGDPEVAGRLADRLGGYVAVENGAPAEASALLDGVPTPAIATDVLRSRVLVQDKDPVLLSGTVAELLDVPRSGRVGAAEAVGAAAAHDVLDALRDLDGTHDPLDGRLTERGRTLSGGQRQRLALARSLVADPEVLVLDEPTSAVDAHTEARLARSLKAVREGRTTVVLSSSPLLLEHADTVVLVDPGRAPVVGTHRALLDLDRYRSVVTREEEE